MMIGSHDQQALRMLMLASVFGATFSISGTVGAHGTIVSPESRVWNCRQEGPEALQSEACKAAKAVSGTQQFYDWNGIRQGDAGGNHQNVVPNGQLCSGGDPNTFGGLDLARSDWPATSVNSGPQTFTWDNPATHDTAYYQYYITRSDYDVTQPLTWADLEQIAQTDPSPRESSPSHTINLPPRDGRHVIYSVWQRSDSPEAFYACVDVAFGGGNTDAGPDTGGRGNTGGGGGTGSGGDNSGGNTCIGVPNWENTSSYLGGDQVRFNDSRFEAKWWTSGENPSTTSSEWAVWIDQGDCADAGENTGGGGDTGGENACVGIPNWETASVYVGGDQVRYNDSRYVAKWWTSGENPSTASSEWAVWANEGSCAVSDGS